MQRDHRKRLFQVEYPLKIIITLEKSTLKSRVMIIRVRAAPCRLHSCEKLGSKPMFDANFGTIKKITQLIPAGFDPPPRASHRGDQGGPLVPLGKKEKNKGGPGGTSLPLSVPRLPIRNFPHFF